MSFTTYDMMLTDEYERKLRLEIQERRRENNDEFRKWATLFFAVIGAILASISVLSKQRQPDPCPRNYYRSDSGLCVFALQTNSAKRTQIDPQSGAGDTKASYGEDSKLCGTAFTNAEVQA
jgi:hypothetical protein